MRTLASTPHRRSSTPVGTPNAETPKSDASRADSSAGRVYRSRFAQGFLKGTLYCSRLVMVGCTTDYAVQCDIKSTTGCVDERCALTQDLFTSLRTATDVLEAEVRFHRTETNIYTCRTADVRGE
ncbi:hypothetical protein J6590_037653 [Homalodisca vitripennis]|nr:hypothetical protein J6590_037653 [Homalodisca vitripennis]